MTKISYFTMFFKTRLLHQKSFFAWTRVKDLLHQWPLSQAECGRMKSPQPRNRPFHNTLDSSSAKRLSRDSFSVSSRDGSQTRVVCLVKV